MDIEIFRFLALGLVLLGGADAPAPGVACGPPGQGAAAVRVVAYVGTPCLPAAGARIEVPELGLEARSDGRGVATLPALPAGAHEVRVRYEGRSAMVVVRIRPHAAGAVTVLVDLGER